MKNKGSAAMNKGTMMRGLVVAAVGAVVLSVVPATAQGVRCSAFLHDHDGSWRSFEPGIIMGPGGPIRVETGERFYRGAPSARDYVAHYLDHFCQSP